MSRAASAVPLVLLSSAATASDVEGEIPLKRSVQRGSGEPGAMPRASSLIRKEKVVVRFSKNNLGRHRVLLSFNEKTTAVKMVTVRTNSVGTLYAKAYGNVFVLTKLAKPRWVDGYKIEHAGKRVF